MPPLQWYKVFNTWYLWKFDKNIIMNTQQQQNMVEKNPYEKPSLNISQNHHMYFFTWELVLA